jgi:hypothetical protein
MLENIVAFTLGALLVVAIVYIYKKEKAELITLINKLEKDIETLFHKTKSQQSIPQTMPTASFSAPIPNFGIQQDPKATSSPGSQL